MKYKDVRITDRVYSVASSHIFSTGLKRWHMEQLAEECGLTKRTLYKIVPNKEKMVEQVMLRFINSVQQGQLQKDLEPVFIIEMLQAFVLYFIRSDPTSAQSPAKIRAAVDCLLHGISRN